MFYVVERYLPGLARSDFLGGLSRLERALEEPIGERPPVRYIGSTIVIGDEACYCHFEACSEEAVVEANRDAGLSFDRIVPAVSLSPTRGEVLMTTQVITPRSVRTRRVALLASAAALVAAAVVAVLLAIGQGTKAPQHATAPTAQEQRYVQAISSLTAKQLAAAFGTATVHGRPSTTPEQRRAEAMAALSQRTLSAAFGTRRP
jgi:hypothetical protein